MQVFIVGTPIETAYALDKRRLNKQIIECNQILKAINNESKAWANHPCTLQYSGFREWLKHYVNCLTEYKNGNQFMAEQWSMWADIYKPIWHTKEYFNQMKRRLYTKDNEHYKQWKDLGESDVNWYNVKGKWKYYKNGKIIKNYEAIY